MTVMRIPDHRLTIALMVVSIIAISGCIGTTPGNSAEPRSDSPIQHTDQTTTTGSSNNPGADNTGPRAELLSFKRLDSECLDTTGMGSNNSIDPTDGSERLIINRAIKTNSPDVDLDASLSQNGSSATNWTLNITTRVNDTDARTCTGRVQYRAVIQIWNTSEYRVTFLNDGKWSGDVFSGDHGGGGSDHGGGGSEHGGGGSGVVYAPTPENNTTTA